MSNIQILKKQLSLDIQELTHQYMFVDTNFLIDAFQYGKQFNEILSTVRMADCTLLSIDAVLFEFTRGSRSLVENHKKIAFFNGIIEAIVPVDKIIIGHTSELSAILLKRSAHVSYTDILLLGAIMKYKNAFLLSRDKSDISTTIFPILMNIYIETPDNNKSFALYQYDENAYIQRLETLVNKE